MREFGFVWLVSVVPKADDHRQWKLLKGLFSHPDKKPLEALFELARDRSRWVRACALFALGEVGSKRFV